jgi:acetylornithine deacetylase
MDPLTLACDLVAIPSVSAESNAPVSNVIEQWLRQLEFAVERQEFVDPAGVRQVNILGRKGCGRGGVAYFAHTDVVPAATWSCPDHGPFVPTVRDGRLYGRGSCDMKGSVAAFLAAAARIPTRQLTAPLYVICTADEEVGYHGAKHVAAHSTLYRELVRGGARGVIGEPTELEVVHAHKGGYGFRVISRGHAAHTSTRDGLNANWAMIPFLQEMHQIYRETLDDPAWLHADFDPPDIRWNLCVSDHEPVLNMTAKECVCRVGFRPMPGQQPQRLMDRARQAAERCGLEFEVLWQEGPLWTDPQSEFIQELLKLADRPAPRTVAFGTDGCCFHEVRELAVIGPGSVRQAHTDDEWLSLEQLHAGVDLFERIIRRWCTAA